ncbi:MAG: hypothetical protein QE285_04680 [Aquabacterium sp.]|nr:hypothetical protein [Aquabacterium sp.]
MQRVPERDRWPLGLIWLVLCALLADWSGLHSTVGAFLAGVVVDAHWFDRRQLVWLAAASSLPTCCSTGR